MEDLIKTLKENSFPSKIQKHSYETEIYDVIKKNVAYIIKCTNCIGIYIGSILTIETLL